MADRVLVVYVRKDATGRRNFKAGVAAGTWGWEADHPDHHLVGEGDWLLFACASTGGVRSKTEIGKATFEQVHVAELRSPVYRDEAPIWTDKTYPHRVRFDLFETRGSVPAAALPPDVVEGIRQSTTRGCRGAFVETEAPLFDLVGSTPRVHPTDAQFRRVAALPGDLDRLSPGKQRVEQQYLRGLLFGGSSQADCTLCGRTLPVALLVAAHVKPRRDCTDDERRDAANVVMAACRLGCDELYEKGYLVVDEDGRVRTRPSGTPPDLATALSRYEGRACTAFRLESASYFEWHRKQHGF